MRLPVDTLMPFIPQIMEGILLWCEDSKNKFRLKVGLNPRHLPGLHPMSSAAMERV